jgi:heptosyltransferase-3
VPVEHGAPPRVSPPAGGDTAVDPPQPPRKPGKRVELLLKRLLDRALSLVAGSGAESLADVRDVRRVLVVRPNFRIGNTLLATPLIAALHARFPGAAIEMLVGDSTASLLEQLPLDAVHVVSRGFLRRPWRFVALFRELRRRRYDVAIDGGLGSLSGGLYAYLTGARHRIGSHGAGDAFLTVRLPTLARGGHVSDRIAAFARQLGEACGDRPVYQVADVEAEAAAERLAATAVGCDRAFVALFVGGHLDKRFPLGRWLGLIDELRAAGCPLLVFVGPEERRMLPRFAERAPGAVVPPGPLRLFAALLARAAIVVTPDSGALHLSVALGRPTIALLQQERSLRFRPRGPDDVVLLRPHVADVLDALRAQRPWPELVHAAACDDGDMLRAEGGRVRAAMASGGETDRAAVARGSPLREARSG